MDYAWFSATLYGYQALGWGEYQYSSPSGVAPFRNRPNVNPGSSFTTTTVAFSNHYYSRTTDLGVVYVNVTSSSGGFIASAATAAATTAAAGNLKHVVCIPHLIQYFIRS
jgi:hypothetical protein